MSLGVVIRSLNRKIGPISATYRTIDSCPTGCPFYKRGCYANGRLFGLATKHGVGEKQGITKLIQLAPYKGMVRHHVSGDLMNGDRVDKWYLGMLKWLVRKRPDLQHILYTHGWRKLKPEDLPFIVNASCETPEDAQEAIRRGFEAVITVREEDSLVGTVIAGKKVIRCPEEYRPGVTCATCKLCSRPRKSIVAFVVHGAGKRKATEAINELR